MHAGTLTMATHDLHPPTPPTSPPPPLYGGSEDDVCYSVGGWLDLPRTISEATRFSLRDIHFIDSSSGSEDDWGESGRRGRGTGGCEGGGEAGGEDAVLIRDEVCAAEVEGASATVEGDEQTAAPRRSRSHDGGRPAAVTAPPSECVMQHKCGAAPPQDSGEAAVPRAPMAASDTAQQQPVGSGSAMVTTSSVAPLRSALKRAGQKSKGHRVCINEAKNRCLEADYVILVHEENEPQLVSIKSFDLSLLPGSGDVEQLTLSPPEGYKDCFSHAVHETIVDDSDTESGSGDGVVDGDVVRPHLPDLLSHQAHTQLTVENVRHHDQLMQGKDTTEAADTKVAKTGILKGGKLWKNGGDSKRNKAVEVEVVEEPRRSVRFSGRDEHRLLENLPLDKIPLDAANSAALAKFMPKLRELGMLLGESQEDWHVELSPLNPEKDNIPGVPRAEPADEQEKQLPPQMNDEQISESMKRYDEMRHRIAVAEGRDNTSVCSDESKSSSDSQSSDSTMTETRIRRLENSDVANIAGGVMRSNSEVRRAIERNALRRSLIRFSEARKKDTNKNEKNEKAETSLLEKLKWLTASEDATNGNNEGDDEEEEERTEEEQAKEIDPRVQETITQYRKLAEMFNKTTSLRANDILVPGDVREWKLKADLFPEQQKPAPIEQEHEDMDEAPTGSTTPTVYKAMPAVSMAELVSEEDNDKLIYSGGVRYTREGTLPLGEDGEEGEEEEDQQGNATTSAMADARKQFLSQMSNHPPVPMVNGLATHSRDRSSVASNSDSYTFDDIDEALHDDHSSSVPSSSQSSPRLSGRSDMDGTSTTESGYSSNETNGELCPVNGLPVSAVQVLGLPPGGVDIDELAEFVRQDAGRIERLRRRYDAGEIEDHGFNRRPSVRGIKPRFGSTTDLLKQMATQLAPPAMANPAMAGSHMTWPYRESGDDDSSAPQRRRAAPNRTVLPALQEDILYVPTSDLSPQAPLSASPSTAQINSLTHTKAPRVVHVYSSTGDLRAPPPPRLAAPRESPPPDLVRPGGPGPTRAHSHTTLSQLPQHGSVQSLVMAPQMPAPYGYEHHYPTCRRPASVHGHVPADAIVVRDIPPPPMARPHSTLAHYPPPRVPVHYHSYEEPPTQHLSYESGHPPLGQRGSYPGTIPAPQYQPQMLPPELGRYPNPPGYGPQHPHSRPPVASPREGVPYSRTPHPQAHPLPQVSPLTPGPVQVHQCGPRHHPPPRMVSGTMAEPTCSTVWSHHPPPPHIHQSYPPHPVSSHLSYTTPIVPESGMSIRTSGPVMGGPIGHPMGPPLINGNIGKLDGLRDERGVPEGASSSPRGPVDPQYPTSHASPTRETSTLHRHPPPPMHMT